MISGPELEIIVSIGRVGRGHGGIARVLEELVLPRVMDRVMKLGKVKLGVVPALAPKGAPVGLIKGVIDVIPGNVWVSAIYKPLLAICTKIRLG